MCQSESPKKPMDSAPAHTAGLSALEVLAGAHAVMSKLEQFVKDELISEGEYMQMATRLMELQTSLQVQDEQTAFRKFSEIMNFFTNKHASVMEGE